MEQGSQVYFRKYASEETERVFRPGAVLTVEEVFEDGSVRCSYKGSEQVLQASEVRIKTSQGNRVSQNMREEAAQNAVRQVDPVTEKDKMKAFTDPSGMPLSVVLLGDMQKALIEEQRDPLEYANSVYTQAVGSQFRVGGVLAYMHELDLHKEYMDENGQFSYTGRNGFFRFVAEKCNIKERTARMWEKVYLVFTNYGIDESVVRDIGISRAHEIACIATQDTIEQWIERARTMTTEELKKYISINYRHAVGHETEVVELRPAATAKLLTFKFSVFEDQAALLRQSLDSVKGRNEDMETEYDGQLLMQIVTDWIDNQSDVAPATPQASIDFLNARFPHLTFSFTDHRTSAQETETEEALLATA